MASYEELLEATGKEYLTPTEFRILNERQRSGGLEDMLMGSGKAYAGMLRDLYKSNIEGDEKYDRDWNWSDAVDPAMDALSVFGLRPAAAALKSKFAVGAAKGAGKGLQKGYSVATGAKRGGAAAPKIGGPKGSMPKSSGKKTLDAPDGKVPDAKPGMMQKAGTAIKNNPIKSTIAGLGGAAGINAMLPDAPEGLDPLEKTAEDETLDQGANQNLDNPNGQMAMTPEGQAQAAMQAKANSMPGMVNRQGGSGSKMPSLAQGRVQAQANFMADDIIKQQKKQSDQNNFLRDRYDATGGRRAGAWGRLSEAQKDLATRNYGQNSYYDSNPNATGGTAVSDIARAELGMPSMEEQRLADLDARVEQQRMSNMGYGVAADSENYQGALPSMSKEDFSKKSGMQNEGTGITQNADGSFNTLEFGEAHENAGGRETAADYLETVRNGDELLAGLDNFGAGTGQAPVETTPGQFTPETTTTTMTDPGTNPFTRQNIDEPFRNRPRQFETNTTPASFEAPEYQGSGRGMYTDQFGQQSALGEGTVRMSANDQDYGGGFKSREDALGMVNRGASLDEPAPETPAPEAPAPEAPEAPEEEGGWDEYAPYLAPLALAHPATRKMGQKMLPKFKKNMKQLGNDWYDAVPMKTPGGYAPRLGNSPLKLPNKNPALPHRAPGLPHRADPNIPAALPNKSMSAPAGRQVTPEQFRRAQTGMGPSERASAVGAKEAQERAVVDRMRQMNRKAQLEREARARRLAGQPMNPNPYGVPGNQIHMNGQLPAKRPPFPN